MPMLTRFRAVSFRCVRDQVSLPNPTMTVLHSPASMAMQAIDTPST